MSNKNFTLRFGAALDPSTGVGSEVRFKFGFHESLKDFIKKNIRGGRSSRSRWNPDSKEWCATVPQAHVQRIEFWESVCETIPFAQVNGFAIDFDDGVKGDCERTLGKEMRLLLLEAAARLQTNDVAAQLGYSSTGTQHEASLDGLEANRRTDAPADLPTVIAGAFGVAPSPTNTVKDIVSSAPLFRMAGTNMIGRKAPRQLFAHQAEGMQFFADNGGRVILAHEQGLGKTTTATGCAEYANAGRIVVVCPEHAREVWREEFTVFTDREVFVFGIDDKPATHWMAKPNAVLVIGYASVIRQTVIERLGLQPLDFDLMIIDESHYLGDHQSQRTQACDVVAARCKWVIELSGTPIPNGRPRELFPQLRILNPDKFKNYSKYSQRFCGAHKTKFGWDDSGATNVPELYKLLHAGGLMHRKRKSECLDLPSKFRVSMPLPVDKKTFKDAWTLYLSQNQTGVSAANNLRKFTADFLYEPMRDWLVDWLAANPDQKIICFGWHKEFLERFQNDPALAGQCVTHHGDMTPTARQLSLGMWRGTLANAPGHPRVLLATIASLGTGVTLIEASHMAFFETSWVPGDMLQAEDRIHRIGQGDQCTYYYFWAAGTVLKKVIATLGRKMAIAHKVLEGTKLTAEELRDNSPDIFNDIIAIIEQSRPADQKFAGQHMQDPFVANPNPF